MIIDAHHHLWDLTARDQPWIDGPDLSPLRRDFLVPDFEREAEVTGVTGSVVVQTVAGVDETPDLLAIAADSPLVGGVVGWVDLTRPDVADQLSLLRALPGGELLVGVRHPVHSEPDPDWLIQPDVLRGLSAVAEAGLVYDLVVTRAHLPAATRAASMLPELIVVLDHLGNPPIASGLLHPWADLVRDLAALPNVVCKLSGMVTEADWHRWRTADLRPYAETVLDAFGPDRVMFGSDWPVSTLAATYREVFDAARELTELLSPTERRAVFAETASRVYGLRDVLETA